MAGTPSIRELLTKMIREGASDLHITTGSPPVLRVAVPGGKEERLLPYVEAVVRVVSLADRRIVVDWGADW
jgi:ribosomal 30S subunit maturation factor RimM